MGTANTFGTIGAFAGPSMSGPASAADTVTPKAPATTAALSKLFRRIIVIDLHYFVTSFLGFL